MRRRTPSNDWDISVTGIIILVVLALFFIILPLIGVAELREGEVKNEQIREIIIAYVIALGFLIYVFYEVVEAVVRLKCKVYEYAQLLGNEKCRGEKTKFIIERLEELKSLIMKAQKVCHDIIENCDTEQDERMYKVLTHLVGSVEPSLKNSITSIEKALNLVGGESHVRN